MWLNTGTRQCCIMEHKNTMRQIKHGRLQRTRIALNLFYFFFLKGGLNELRLLPEYARKITDQTLVWVYKKKKKRQGTTCFPHFASHRLCQKLLGRGGSDCHPSCCYIDVYLYAHVGWWWSFRVCFREVTFIFSFWRREKIGGGGGGRVLRGSLRVGLMMQG